MAPRSIARLFGRSHRSRGRSQAWAAATAAVTVATALALGTACRRPPPGCEHDSLERCLWEQGAPTPGDGGDGDGGEGSSLAPGELGERSELDATLAAVVEIMSDGLEWPLVEARARELCLEEPLAAADEGSAGAVWSCQLDEAIQLGQRSVVLEAGGGVLALTVGNLSADASAELLTAARGRFAAWCAGDPFIALEARIHEEFQRCTLAEGPYLLVGRFPRDLDQLDAERWQVSIAVIDTG